MKRILSCTVLLACAATLLTGCISAPVVPPVGIAYTNFQAPLDIDYDNTSVTGKRGIAESVSILGLISTGNASAENAAASAGIDTIEHADYEFFNVLGIYQRYRTVVYGK